MKEIKIRTEKTCSKLRWRQNLRRLRKFSVVNNIPAKTNFTLCLGISRDLNLFQLQITVLYRVRLPESLLYFKMHSTDKKLPISDFFFLQWLRLMQSTLENFNEGSCPMDGILKKDIKYIILIGNLILHQIIMTKIISRW